MPLVRVFIAGSRAISRLNDSVRDRLDRIVVEGHDVLVGDANGADRAVQQHLADRRYDRVTVYCTGGRCRNNIGHWPVAIIDPPQGIRGGFDFYAAKDRAMALQATHGLMLWDGESRGTLTNVRNLLTEGKPVVVYLSPERTFTTIRTAQELDTFLPVGRVPSKVHNQHIA